MINITKTLGMIVIGFFALGLALEAATKLTVGLLMVTFWGIILGLVLMGIAGFASCWKGGR